MDWLCTNFYRDQNKKSLSLKHFFLKKKQYKRLQKTEDLHKLNLIIFMPIGYFHSFTLHKKEVGRENIGFPVKESAKSRQPPASC